MDDRAGATGNGQRATGDRRWDDWPEDDPPSGFMETGRSISDFRDLDVWKSGIAFATDIYRATAKFPRAELYGLTSQMRRASVSVPTNIAEGYGRGSSRAYVYFLKIAHGSAKELESLIEIAVQLEFLDRGSAGNLTPQAQRISKMLWSLIRSIEVRQP